MKAEFSLAAVRGALKTAAAAVLNANSIAAKFCSGLVGIKDSCKFSLQLKIWYKAVLKARPVSQEVILIFHHWRVKYYLSN